MNKNQTQDKSKKENMGVVGEKAAADKSSDKKGKGGKQGGNSGAVLGEINDDPKKKQK